MDTQSLFGKKKLLVIKHALSSENAFFPILQKECSRIAADAAFFVIFWDHALDAKGKKFAAEIRHAVKKEQEFLPLSGASLRKWILEEAKERKAALLGQELDILSSFEGDSWRIINEMEKLAVGRMPQRAHIVGRAEDGAWRVQESTDIFQFGDAFFAARNNARRMFYELLARGEEDFKIFSYLASRTRTLLLIKFFMEASAPIPPRFGIHPFVIKKSSALARGLSQEYISELLKKFFEADVRIKRGVTTPKEAILSMLSAA